MNFIANIIVLLVFPYAVDAFGFAPTFYFFSCCMALGAVYATVDLFETKNMNLQEIELKVFGHITKVAAVETEL